MLSEEKKALLLQGLERSVHADEVRAWRALEGFERLLANPPSVLTVRMLAAP